MEPLSATQLTEVVNAVAKPDIFAKLSVESESDFREEYGEQGRLDQNFQNASPECAAVSDFDRVTRFARGGSSYRKFMPSDLRDFNEISGLAWNIESGEESDESAFAKVEIALLSFDNEDSALSHSSTISDNLEYCFDFKEEGDTDRALELTRFDISEDGSGDFAYEFASYESVGYIFVTEISTDMAIAVTHFGPNLLVVTVSASQNASESLGVDFSSLVSGMSEISGEFENTIATVQTTGDSNAVAAD